MIGKVSEWVLHWRRMTMTLVGLTVVVIEIGEHRPESLGELNLDLLREVLLFGFIFPFVGAVLLDELARMKVEQPDPMIAATLNSNITANFRWVIIVENDQLLGAGIERLLKDEVQFKVVGISSPDKATLLEMIRQVQPTVVIMDVTYLRTIPISLLAELLDVPDLRVMVLNANDDRVQIYYKQQLLITQAAELVNAIRGS